MLANNQESKQVLVTTFVKGLYSLEPQTVKYCDEQFYNAGFEKIQQGYAIYTEKEGGEHYREHRDKFISSNGEKAKYYPGLIKYITQSGPVFVIIWTMSLEKARAIAPQFGLEVREDITEEENIQLVYDLARVITKKCRTEVMAGYEEGTSITKIRFDDPIEGPRTQNVLHCSDCFNAAIHEYKYAVLAMSNFKVAQVKNPKIIEDARKELMPYEFGNEVNY